MVFLLSASASGPSGSSFWIQTLNRHQGSKKRDLSRVPDAAEDEELPVAGGSGRELRAAGGLDLDDGLGATELFNRLLPTMPWNSLLDRMMRELHAQGRTSEDIAECLKEAPLDPHIISAIKSAHSLGCDLRVVSDANMFFIATILKHHGVLECFTEINTNPSSVDEEGRLMISPHHDFNKSSHGCSLCPPNMCKGKIIERIRASAFAEGRKWFIYLGDGKGDYCPSLKLREGDCVMPRKNYPVWDLIASNVDLIKAEIHEWSNGDELERTLLQLIDRSDRGGVSAQLLSGEFKIRTTSHEAFPRALPVRQ